MLQIIRSNRVEALLAALAHQISGAPLASPFTVEVVVIPSPAMARWVNLQLARRQGIAANIDYPLPASFIWQLAHGVLDDLPETDPLALEVLTWKVFAALPERLAEPAFAPLRRYLVGDENGLRRWQLAARIADVFDRYQLYRPEQIRDWSAGCGEDWQAVLWRGLVEGLEAQHRVAVIDRLLAALSTPEVAAPAPERVSVFAVPSLPPLLVEVIHALAERTAVDLYLHAPTDAFWADLIPQKALARKRLERPDEAELWEVGNSLLASWGRQGQALQDLLLARETPLQERDACHEPPDQTLLGCLQRDIFRLRELTSQAEREAVPVDDSLQVHIAHSPLRECQVLHDQLLAMLEAEPELRPEDILVMIPEISAYAPYIEAVFDQDGEHERPFIPWNLSDISVADEHPLVQVFLQLLNLPDSRFTHSEVISYLDVPELAAHFGLDGEAIGQIKAWLAEANLRWGRDGAHKARLGLPATEENTWAQAERRLFAGYALGEVELFDGIAPIGGLDGTKAEALGRFWRLVATLTETAERLAIPRLAADWPFCLNALLTDFFGEQDDEDGRLQRIRDGVADLAEQAGRLDERLSLALVRDWLKRRLATESRRGRYFSGGVTFCGMRPMRSLPFAVICILGLHDQAFPRRDRLAELDLLRRGWRPGDPRKRDEDRYLFLETLLCARRRLYLSYVGRSIRDNTERQPSVLLQELLDYIDQQYRPADGAPEVSLSERLSQIHPLQPFSPRRFVDRAGSYDDYWCDLAKALRAPAAAAPAEPLTWPAHRLPEAPERLRDLTLGQLGRFLAHPIRYFVNSRLQLYLAEETPPEDEEAFALDGLERYLLKQQLVADGLQGRAAQPRLRAEGRLPHAAFAGPALEDGAEQVADLLERLAPYRVRLPETRSVELSLDGPNGAQWLTGPVKDLYPGLGLLRWSPSRLKGADILGLWLAHLACCASGAPPEPASTLHTPEAVFAIREVLAPQAARAALADYIDWYWEGVHRPLLVLPRASFAYASARHHGGRADPMKAAHREWRGNSFNGVPGDGDDAYVQLILRGLSGDPLADADFPRLAGALYDQVLACGALS